MTEVVVVGGGPAGSAAAIQLARRGVRVSLYERRAEPHHKICGEFLSSEALTMLRGLDIDVATLGAIPLENVGVAGRDRSEPHTVRLPFAAASLSRRDLDEALLQRASAAGVDVVRGVALRDGAAELRFARAVLIATGKHDWPGHPRPPGEQPDLIGFKMHYATARELPRHVVLVPFAHGYAGWQPIAAKVGNLCLLVHRSRYAQLRSYAAVVADMQRTSPWLARTLEGAAPLWDKPLAIGHVPYGFVRRRSQDRFWLGDQAAVIPSFAGDGIAIALHSAMRAAEAVLGSCTASTYQSALAAELESQVWRATRISKVLVAPWFQPFGHLVARVPGLVRTLARATRVAA